MRSDELVLPMPLVHFTNLFEMSSMCYCLQSILNILMLHCEAVCYVQTKNLNPQC